jgi:hypothetical protein
VRYENTRPYYLYISPLRRLPAKLERTQTVFLDGKERSKP